MPPLLQRGDKNKLKVIVGLSLNYMMVMKVTTMENGNAKQNFDFPGV